uniref:Capsid protein n=1 Tax=Phylloscopus inornatus Genomoviridae sp. TaxID=2814958 RepID=A0A8E7G279_9VIRU|nr:MAG: capsid protein [Gemycircularvirus]
MGARGTYRRRTRRVISRKRTSRRVSYVKKRRYRKTRKPMMTKKRILNVTSKKKRNGMLSWSNTTASGGSQITAQGPAYVNGSTGGLFLFCPTAMDLTVNNTPNLFIDASNRTSTTCYMRGLSEHIRIQTSSPIPWFWRRICFTVKGFPFLRSASPTNPEDSYVETNNGMERLWLNIGINNSTVYYNSITALLFKGVSQKDWTDPLIAPLDTSRVTVKYDKTWTIKSGNAAGAVTERKHWFPMNHNLVYDDDESGTTTDTSFRSVSSKAGMGDYYVLDFFSSGTGGGVSDLIRIDSNATLYWHEK